MQPPKKDKTLSRRKSPFHNDLDSLETPYFKKTVSRRENKSESEIEKKIEKWLVGKGVELVNPADKYSLKKIAKFMESVKKEERQGTGSGGKTVCGTPFRQRPSFVLADNPLFKKRPSFQLTFSES